MGIFAVVSLIFLNSVYSLFTDGKFAGESERQPIAVNQVKDQNSTAQESRKPASRGNGLDGFVPYETRCQATGEIFETEAAKVRILGPFCGATPAPRGPATDAQGAAAPDGQYRVENTTTRFTATVFSDSQAGKFSTDFIPLDPGSNRIVMEFRYRSGKVFPVELTVIRKAAAE